MIAQHKRPMAAFVAVAALCAVLVVSATRGQALRIIFPKPDSRVAAGERLTVLPPQVITPAPAGDAGDGPGSSTTGGDDSGNQSARSLGSSTDGAGDGGQQKAPDSANPGASPNGGHNGGPGGPTGPGNSSPHLHSQQSPTPGNGNGHQGPGGAPGPRNPDQPGGGQGGGHGQGGGFDGPSHGGDSGQPGGGSGNQPGGSDQGDHGQKPGPGHHSPVAPGREDEGREEQGDCDHSRHQSEGHRQGPRSSWHQPDRHSTGRHSDAGKHESLHSRVGSGRHAAPGQSLHTRTSGYQGRHAGGWRAARRRTQPPRWRQAPSLTDPTPVSRPGGLDRQALTDSPFGSLPPNREDEPAAPGQTGTDPPTAGRTRRRTGDAVLRSWWTRSGPRPLKPEHTRPLFAFAAVAAWIGGLVIQHR
ncbi:MAG: hypothetical protein R2731_13045 [Nocardioides sp.]